jgi:hypothetical protein
MTRSAPTCWRHVPQPPARLALLCFALLLATAAAQSSVVGYADSYSINGTAAADYNIGVLYPGSTLVASSCTEDVSTKFPQWDGITAPYGDCGTTLDLVNATSGRLLSPLVITRQSQVVASTCGGAPADVACTIISVAGPTFDSFLRARGGMVNVTLQQNCTADAFSYGASPVWQGLGLLTLRLVATPRPATRRAALRTLSVTWAGGRS